MPEDVLLDSSAVSGRYLFPQMRQVCEPFWLDVGDARLACYRQVVSTDGLTLVHFHGNGEAVADYVPEVSDAFARGGLNSLFVEYRGYGASSGDARLVAMLSDGETALERAGISPETAVLFGRSIGSLYALELAARQPTVAGLVLESGIADPCERFLEYADLSGGSEMEKAIRSESQQYFNHRRKLGAYRGPLLLLHTVQDSMVDFSHAERNLKWSASAAKQLIAFEQGNHNSILTVNWDAYFSAIYQFVNAVRKRQQQ